MSADEPMTSSSDLPQPVDASLPGVADLFDELPLWSAPFGLALLDRLPLADGLTWLDVGAGTGFLSIEIAERCGPATRVYAVEPWEAAADRLVRKIEHRGTAGVSVVRCPIERIDLPAESVDVAVVSLGLNNFDDPDAALASVARLLRRGGELHLSTNPTGHFAELYEELEAALREVAGEAAVANLERHVAHRGTRESIEAAISAAGLEPVDFEERTHRMRFASGAAFLRHYFIRLGFLESWTRLADEAAWAEVAPVLERRLDERAAREGGLTLTVPVLRAQARRAAGASAGDAPRRTSPVPYEDDLARVHHEGFGFHARSCAPAILRYLRPVHEREGTVLELGCGSGILTSALLDAGHHVIATDASEPMLALARRELGADADVRRLVLPDDPLPEVDAIVSVGHVLNYLPSATAIESALEACAKALRPGGRLALDLCDLTFGETRVAAPTVSRAGPDWTLLCSFSLPSPRVFRRDITTFVREESGLWRRSDERHDNVLMRVSDVAGLLRRHGLEVEVRPAFGDETLPEGLFALLAERPDVSR